MKSQCDLVALRIDLEKLDPYVNLDMCYAELENACKAMSCLFI